MLVLFKKIPVLLIYWVTEQNETQNNLKSKFPGPSTITSSMIKKILSVNIIIYITELFNAPIDSGHFPSPFKTAHTVMTHKPATHTDQLPSLISSVNLTQEYAYT